MDTDEARRRLQERFGSREAFLGYQIVMLSQLGQPCDVTFYRRKPIIHVKVDQQIALALMYGAGPKRLAEMMSSIKFSDGTTANLGEIWTINAMPTGGFAEAQLNAVDLSEAEERVGPGGETLRKMIRDTYHCSSTQDEDYYLRRFIAS
jgi:hypothetical protein